MATVIDALVVTLGLDASKFRTGTKQAQGDLKSTADESTKVAKEMEARGAQAAEFFGKIRNSAIGLFAVFTAGKGLQSFTRDSIESNAALGRMAANLGMSAESLNAWQGAAKRTGGSAEGITSSFMGLGQEFQKLALTGTSSIVPLFRTLGIDIADATGKARPMADVLLDLADKFKGMDPQKAIAFGAGIGLDPGTINLLMKGRQGVQELLAEQQKLGVVTGADADAAAKMQKALLDLEQASSKLGTTMLTLAAPGIVKVLETLTDLALWLQQHDNLTTGIFAGLGIAAAAFSIRAIAGVLSVIGAFAKLPVAMGEIALASAAVWAPFIAAMTTLAGVVDIFKRGPTGNIPDSDFEQRGLGRKDGERAGTPVYVPPPESFWNTVRRAVGSTTVPDRIASEDLTPQAGALLDAISVGESGGRYDAKFGGGRVTDFSQHPNDPKQITSGPNAGQSSTAAGRYQFIKSTWDEAQKALNLPDFSPQSQDKAAWWLAKRDYYRRTQRDLQADLASDDPKIRAGVGTALHNTWTSLPGGIEPNRATSGFNAALDRGLANPKPVDAAVAGPAPLDPGIANATRPGRGGGDMQMSRNTTNSSAVTINGPITVSTNATDAQGVAAGLKGALMKYSFVPQANSGLA